MRRVTRLVTTIAVLLAAGARADELAVDFDSYPLPNGGETGVLTPNASTSSLWLTATDPARLIRIRPSSTRDTQPVIEEIQTPPDLGEPGMFTATAGGNLWLTGAKGVARLDRNDEFTVFPHEHAHVGGITVGRDGKVWFVFAKEKRELMGRVPHFIGKLSTDLKELEVIPIDADGVEPLMLIVAPDGNVWGGSGLFAKSAVVRFKADGAIAAFPRESGTPFPAAGPDGNVWFADGAKIGRVVPATGEIKEFAAVNAVEPNMITAGPDGALWFTSGETGKIGRMTIDGKVETVAVPGGGEPVWITAGPDGNLWLSANDPPRICRVRMKSMARP